MDQFFRKTLNQITKCFENKHASSHKLYVSQFGNIERSGFFIYYAFPGVDETYWKEILYEDFVKAARPEAIQIIDFIVKHKRLPNYVLNDVPYEYRKIL